MDCYQTTIPLKVGNVFKVLRVSSLVEAEVGRCWKVVKVARVWQMRSSQSESYKRCQSLPMVLCKSMEAQTEVTKTAGIVKDPSFQCCNASYSLIFNNLQQLCAARVYQDRGKVPILVKFNGDEIGSQTWMKQINSSTRQALARLARAAEEETPEDS